MEFKQPKSKESHLQEGSMNNKTLQFTFKTILRRIK